MNYTKEVHVSNTVCKNETIIVHNIVDTMDLDRLSSFQSRYVGKFIAEYCVYSNVFPGY